MSLFKARMADGVKAGRGVGQGVLALFAIGAADRTFWSPENTSVTF